jgi:hypothetical protein
VDGRLERAVQGLRGHRAAALSDAASDRWCAMSATLFAALMVGFAVLAGLLVWKVWR